MRNKNIRIALEESEVKILENIIKKGKNNARTISRAQLLLMANTKNEERIKDRDIVKILKKNKTTVFRIKKRYQEGGIERAIYDKERPGQPKRLSVQEEAEIVAIACTEAPKGYERWTIELLTERVNKEFKKRISKSSVNRVLLKNDTKPWLKKNVVHK